MGISSFHNQKKRQFNQRKHNAGNSVGAVSGAQRGRETDKVVRDVIQRGSDEAVGRQEVNTAS